MTDENSDNDLEENLLFDKHTLVYMTNSNNRMATSDDLLETKLETYFEQNDIDDDDHFEVLFDECRSLCANCVYYDADLNLNKMKEPWNKFKAAIKGNRFGRCTALPPNVIKITKDNKEVLKTINPITYPSSFCSMFYHRANDKRNIKDYNK